MYSKQQNIQYGVYNTNHRKRGTALVFVVHEDRKGSHRDLKDLQQVLKHLQFDVRSYEDYTAAEVRKVLAKVSKEDHTNSDCLLIVSMTHGSKDRLAFVGGDIFCIDELWMDLVGNKCPSLIGKPKLVFVQSCRGKKYDVGCYHSFLQVDAAPKAVQPVNLCLPMYADLLVMYSTYEDHVSFRSETDGSWFIQSLCQVLGSDISKKDLLALLTHVTYLVSCRSTPPQPGSYKQVPVMNSSLCKAFYFVPKLSKATHTQQVQR
ncbi:caspase-1-like [Anopheles moucheti]|uniref:caspase-1-like n=1 Tax=Anopheles moucheti TaxID=186751 RepID=UPI0022F070D9|nr:caspase-1-like [Anopheles moucheti]